MNTVGNTRKISHFPQEKDGGAEGIRTPDPHNAIVVLYQLSYDPIQNGQFRAPQQIVKTILPRQTILDRPDRRSAPQRGPLTDEFNHFAGEPVFMVSKRFCRPGFPSFQSCSLPAADGPRAPARGAARDRFVLSTCPRSSIG
jgi:hypothetical protein